MLKCPECGSNNVMYQRKGDSRLQHSETFMCHDCHTKFAVEVVDGEQKAMEYYDECDTSTQSVY